MIDWIKEHKLLTAGLVVGIIVLFRLLRSGGSSSSASSGGYYSGPSESLQAMQIQTGAALQGAVLQANTDQAKLNAAVNIAEMGYAYDYAKTVLGAQFASQELLVTADVTKYQTDAAVRVALAQQGQSQPIATVAPTLPVGNSTIVTSNGAQISGSANRNLPGGEADAWAVVGSGGGQVIHGVETAPVYGFDRATALANDAAVIDSYAKYPGSYLADGVFAHTPEAWKIYGDPSIPYDVAKSKGYI